MKSKTLDILVVDSDPLVAAAIHQAAQGLRFELVWVGSAERALALVESELPEPELVMSGFHLPGNDGLWLLSYIKSHHPEVKCLLYTDETQLPKRRGLDIPVLFKPCRQEALRELIASFM